MPKHYKFTEDEVVKAVKGSGGFVTEIARRLGCHRATIYAYKKRYPSIAEAIFEEKENLLDTAESALLSQIGSGNLTAIIFYLKTQGYGRGYGSRSLLELNAVGEVAKEREDDEKADASYVSKVMAELDKLGYAPTPEKLPEKAVAH